MDPAALKEEFKRLYPRYPGTNGEVGRVLASTSQVRRILVSSLSDGGPGGALGCGSEDVSRHAKSVYDVFRSGCWLVD